MECAVLMRHPCRRWQPITLAVAARRIALTDARTHAPARAAVHRCRVGQQTRCCRPAYRRSPCPSVPTLPGARASFHNQAPCVCRAMNPRPEAPETAWSDRSSRPGVVCETFPRATPPPFHANARTIRRQRPARTVARSAATSPPIPWAARRSTRDTQTVRAARCLVRRRHAWRST